MTTHDFSLVWVNDGDAIDALDHMSARDKFKIKTLYVIIEKFIIEMKKRKKCIYD